MHVYLRIDINLAAMVLLGVVFAIAFIRMDRHEPINRLFLKTSAAILVELFLETATCVINHRPESWLIPVSVWMHLCLFITAPILTCYWYSFIQCWVQPEEPIANRKKLLLWTPVVFNGIITALSPLWGLVFSVGSDNVYHRGPLFMVSALIIYFYLCGSLILIFKQRKKLVRHEFFPLFVFGFLPLAGGLLQSLFYGILLMWSCTAFSLVIVYIFIQQRMIHLDDLTGVWTRGSFDYYIAQRAEAQRIGRFGTIFIDMDGLKSINDTYGHYEGDRAIQTTVRLVRKALEKHSVVARFGGDEFVVVLDCESREELDVVMAAIDRNFSEYNSISGKPYLLECSMGGDMYSPGSGSIEQFLSHVDQLMYANKKCKKEL